MRPPEIVVHADWSVDPAKRWCAHAVRLATGGYAALAPQPVGSLDDFIASLLVAAGPGGTVFAGFDFPLGLPRAYAEAVKIDNFASALTGFGRGRWRDFYTPAARPDEISLRRPFYPARPGGSRHRHLYEALGFSSIQGLRRRCDGATATRLAASPLFWTLGGQQVGKAAISGWRDLLAPARRSGVALSLWPFEGDLADLLDRPGIVVAETYPGEIYSHLRLRIGAGNKSKRRQADRCDDSDALLEWAGRAGVQPAAALAADIREGFGGAATGEDRFDATVGLFGMLNVALGFRPPGDPAERVLRRVEGWILGQQPAGPLAD
ncbi:MAG: hypothetical protein O2905_07505 [Proteobacteria bacterium]|nr:hypothetical protein [Pseudomonadota bacterium]